MNLRRQRPNDSLDMLLDTMCNTFGGIILLAVLVTLLTSRERQAHNGQTSDTQELLQRRLAIAQTNLKQSLQLSASLQAKTNNNRWKQQVQLLSIRKELQDELKRIREAITQTSKELESSSASEPGERLRFLNNQLAALQARKLEIQNSLAAASENNARLKERLDGLGKQAGAIIAESERPLRLPREYRTGKQVIYVIAHYDHIYLCRNVYLDRNETDINWTKRLDSEIAEPIPDKGIDLVHQSDALKAFLANQSKESIYLVFCVFEDSFPAFIRAKQIVVDARFAYGWEAFRNQDGPVSFSSEGHTPRPQ